jgi:hypothetical protein
MSGAPQQARAWVDRTFQVGQECDDFDVRYATLDTHVRLCIAEGDFARAGEALQQLEEVPRTDGSIRSRRQFITTRAEYLLNVRQDPLPSATLDELQDLHQRMCQRTAHDRTVLVLAAALERGKQKQKARSLVSAYLHEERRGGQQILSALDALKRRLY